MIIIITGPIASGKSAVARSLALEVERRGRAAAAIDMDLVYEMLEQPGVRKDDAAKWARTRRASAAFAEQLLLDGVEVAIVEGELLPAERTEFLGLLHPSRSPRFVTLRVSFECALARVNGDPTRTFSRDPAFLREHYESLQDAFAVTRAGELSVDTESASPEEIARAIADWALPGPA